MKVVLPFQLQLFVTRNTGQPMSNPEQEEYTMATRQTAADNGHEVKLERYEKQLSRYLEKRIKPGLNSGSIPMLSRSIAKEIANGPHPSPASTENESPDRSSDDGDGQHEFEEDMHDLQAEL